MGQEYPTALIDVPIFLYGPSGSGKSTAGVILARTLERDFYDLDELIMAHAGRTIEAIFSEDGEERFRQYERERLLALPCEGPIIVSLGGGALLDSGNRKYVESCGRVILLHASLETLAARVVDDRTARPLIGSQDALTHLGALLQKRAVHYRSFENRIQSDDLTPEEIAWQIQVQLGLFRVTGMGTPYDVVVAPLGLDHIGPALRQRSLNGPVAVVSDANVAPLYMPRVVASLAAAGYESIEVVIPPGEASKNIARMQKLWGEFARRGVERRSTVLALGGGVVGDLAGFAAATYMRGVRWVGIPTSLLAMCDSSLGGKTGADLDEGKNLVGAFHSPALVLADPQVLATLPLPEIRNGMAEVLKAGVIGDPRLFELCTRLDLAHLSGSTEVIRRAMALKIRVILEDPYEAGKRAALNLGHTYGHALESASDFDLLHGEAVAIGMLLEAALAESLNLAVPGTRARIQSALEALGLPVAPPPGIPWEAVWQRMGRDKKNTSGRVNFALPVDIGAVKTGVSAEEAQLCHLYSSFMAQT